MVSCWFGVFCFGAGCLASSFQNFLHADCNDSVARGWRSKNRLAALETVCPLFFLAQCVRSDSVESAACRTMAVFNN